MRRCLHCKGSQEKRLGATGLELEVFYRPVFYSAGTVFSHPGYQSPSQMKLDLLFNIEYVSSAQEQQGKS